MITQTNLDNIFPWGFKHAHPGDWQAFVDQLTGSAAGNIKVGGASSTVEGTIWFDYSTHQLKVRVQGQTLTVAGLVAMDSATLQSATVIRVHYNGTISVTAFSAGDHFVSNELATSTSYAQVDAQTIDVTMDTDCVQNDILAATGGAGVLTPQTINIDA